MPFFNQYELLQLIHDGDVQTFSARDAGSGKLWLLHRFPRDGQVYQRIRSLPPRDMGLFVRAGEEAEFRFIITQDMPEMRRFALWLEAKAPPPIQYSAPPVISNPLSSGSSPDAGASETRSGGRPADFMTKLLQKKASELPANGPPAPSPSLDDDFVRMFGQGGGWAPPAPPAPASEPGLGDITRMFQAPPVAPVATPTTAAPPAAPPAEPPAQAPSAGDFTRMFQLPPDAPPPVAQPPVAANPAAPSDTGFSGDFTRMFQAAPPVTQPPLGPLVPRIPNPPKSPEPGSFTQMFETGGLGLAPDPAPAAAPPIAHDPEATRIFASPPQATPVTPLAPIAPVAPGGKFKKMYPAPIFPQTPASGDTAAFNQAFGQQLPSTPLGDAVDRPSAIPPRPEPTPRPAGEFTSVFGRPDLQEGSGGLFPKPVTPAPGSGAPSAGEYTSMFGRSDVPAVDAVSPAKPSYPAPSGTPGSATGVFGGFGAQPAAPPPGKTGPGEYTMMMQGRPAAPPPASASPAPLEIEEPQKKGNNLVLYLGIGLAVLIVLALIAFFLFFRH